MRRKRTGVDNLLLDWFIEDSVETILKSFLPVKKICETISIIELRSCLGYDNNNIKGSV